MTTDCPKAYKIHDKLYIGLSGLATDAQTFHEKLMFRWARGGSPARRMESRMETRHQPCPPSGNRGHEEGMQARTHARIHPNTYARSCMHPRVLVCIARIHECIQDRVHTFLDAPTLRARALASEIVRTHPQTCTPRQHAHPHARTIARRAQAQHV